MKWIFYIALMAYMILWTYYDANPEEKAQEVILQPEPPDPEPGREVYKFDWKWNRYIYMDQLPYDSGYKVKGEPLPDYYVKSMDAKAPVVPTDGVKVKSTKIRPPWVREVVINGKRYRVYNKPDGTQQLIPIR